MCFSEPYRHWKENVVIIVTVLFVDFCLGGPFYQSFQWIMR